MCVIMDYAAGVKLTLSISTEVQQAPIGFCHSRPSLGYFGDEFFLKLELILSKDKIRVL